MEVIISHGHLILFAIRNYTLKIIEMPFVH